MNAVVRLKEEPELSQGTEWVARLAGSEQRRALAELGQLLDRRLRRAFLRPPGGQDAFVDDVLQESLMKIVGSLDQFRGNSTFLTWATTIAMRCGFTELRRRQWKGASLDHVLEVRETQLTMGATSDPGVSLEKQSLLEDLYTVINEKLTVRQREALLLEIKGMPQEEIGRRTGSNRNAVYKLTHDARKRTKQALEALGYSRADLDRVRGGS